MENHGVQCGKTVSVRNVSFIPRRRRPCDMHGTTNLLLTTIHRLDHDLMQLLKTLERKMVMYNIASNLNGIFRGIGRASEWKINCKKPSG